MPVRKIHRLFLLGGSIFLFAVTGCNPDTKLTPAFKDYRGNGSGEEIEGVERHDPFATLRLVTNAPSLSIKAYTNFSTAWINAATVRVWVDGKEAKFFHLKSTGEETLELPLPGPGKHQVDLVEGTQMNEGEYSAHSFTSIRQVATPAGYHTRVVTPTKAAVGIVAFTDSRGLGGGYEDGSIYAWPVQLARGKGADVYLTGYCSLQAGAHLATLAGRKRITDEIAQRLHGYAHQRVYCQVGVNDYSYATYTPVQLQRYLRDWLTGLRKALPGAKVYLLTDGPKADESRNALGFTLPQYRDAEAAGAAGLTQVIDGNSLWTLADLQDGTHLSKTGDTKVAAKLSLL